MIREKIKLKLKSKLYPLMNKKVEINANTAVDINMNEEYSLIKNSGYFSEEYYLANNPDVKIASVDALSHYMEFGESEGRCPNPYFNPHAYLKLNPDLKAWTDTLLQHYILHGYTENRHYNETFFSNLNRNERSYEDWIKNREYIPFSKVKSKLESFKHNPLISIVVPVYNTDEKYLVACIESVIKQSYTNWQLCLADDKSTKPHVREILEQCSAKDERIKCVFREENGHISAASNSALEIATGEWTALLDHDDELHEHALFYVVDAINSNPKVEFIYSDEDKLNQQGVRVNPHFKSDWNLDYFYSCNYVSHLGVYKTAILNKINGFRVGFEGSQDYDLLLRYSAEIEHSNIIHIPKVLYHWRMIEGSTALSSDGKLYTTEAGLKALKDHFEKINEKIRVEKTEFENFYKVNWFIEKEPLVSIIIPTYNGYEITKQAIDSILDKTSYKSYEILLVDNNSNDPAALTYFEEINQHPQITVLKYPYPFNYSAINNFAAKQAKGEILGLINNDIEVINSEWLTEMVSHVQREDIGCVGAKLYYPNNTIQHAGVIIGLGGVAGHAHRNFPENSPGYFNRLKAIQNFSAVTAACLLVRKSVYDQVGGLNEKELTVAFNDVDFCLKVKTAGYRNLWTPYAQLYHHESITRGCDDSPEKAARFNKEIEYMTKTWKTDLIPDPFYNSNLTLVKDDFSLGN